MGTGFSYNLTPLIGQNLAMNKKIVIGGWLKNSLVANYDYHLIIDSHLTGDLPKHRLFRAARRTLAINKTLFCGLISLDPIRNAL